MNESLLRCAGRRCSASAHVTSHSFHVQPLNERHGPCGCVSLASIALFSRSAIATAGGSVSKQLWSPVKTMGVPGGESSFIRRMMSSMPSRRASALSWSVCVLQKQRQRPVCLSRSSAHEQMRVQAAPHDIDPGTSGVSESQNVPLLRTSNLSLL